MNSRGVIFETAFFPLLLFQTGCVPCSSSVGNDISLKLQRSHHVAVASTILIKL